VDVCTSGTTSQLVADIMTISAAYKSQQPFDCGNASPRFVKLIAWKVPANDAVPISRPAEAPKEGRLVLASNGRWTLPVNIQQHGFEAGMILKGDNVMPLRQSLFSHAPVLVRIDHDTVGVVCSLGLQLNCEMESARTSEAVCILSSQCRAAVTREVEVPHDPGKLVLRITLADQ
jgi:hypothetical protein